MPQRALTIPPLVGVNGAAYVPLTNAQTQQFTPDNFAIALPNFLAGVVSAAIQSGSDPASRVVVEVESYPGDWVALFLTNPERQSVPTLPMNDSANEAGSQFLEGPMATGWARVSAYRNVRIRRIDQGSGVANVWLNFREGAY